MFVKFRYLVFYLGCGFLAALAQAFLNPASQIPIQAIRSNIRSDWGLSSALSAGEYPVFYWVLLFIGTMMVPAYLVLGIWLLEQVLLFPDSMKEAGGWQLLPTWEALRGLSLTPLFKKKGKTFQGRYFTFSAKIEEFASSWDLSPYGKAYSPRSRRPAIKMAKR